MKRILVLTLLMLLLTGACAQELKLNDWNDDVKLVQQQLIDAGYLSGKADGIFGQKTADAVALFQYLNGLTETGAVNAETRALLDSGSARTLRTALSSGAEGEAVSALQIMLIRYGFLTGEADGEYGPATQNAVKAFQQHLASQGIDPAHVSGVPADGVATGLTQEYLFSATYSSYVCDLTEGMADHAEVKRVETRLQTLGYFGSNPDERFDGHTADCLRAFRLAAGFPNDTSADESVIEALFSAHAPATDTPVPHDAVAGEISDSFKPVQEILIRYGFLPDVAHGRFNAKMEDALGALYEYLTRAGDANAPLFADSSVLTIEAQQELPSMDLFHSFGDVSKEADSFEIRRMQNRLHTLYYMQRTELSGRFDSITADALKQFQTNNGLEPTGVADEATQRALYSADPVYDCTAYKIEVSIDAQEVYVYQLTDGAYEKIHTFICSTGLNDRTPRGIFMNTSPLHRWHEFGDFYCYAQYSYVIEGNILFHSVLYSKPDEAYLDYSTVEALGRPASHGCVRLMPEDAQWLCENCRPGTVVVVY